MKCVYLSSATFPVGISPIHSELYHGWYHGRRIGGPRAHYVATNVVASAVHPSADLVVAPPILEALRSIRPLDAQRTDILAAFDYPLEPRDGLEDRFSSDFARSTTAVDNALLRYLKKHATEIEKPTLFDVYPVSGRTKESKKLVRYVVAKSDGHIAPKDRRYYSVAEVVFSDVPSSTLPIASREVKFDPRRLEEHGVVYNWGHIFLPEMFEAIAPHVDNQYFYVEVFEV